MFNNAVPVAKISSYERGGRTIMKVNRLRWRDNFPSPVSSYYSSINLEGLIKTKTSISLIFWFSDPNPILTGQKRGVNSLSRVTVHRLAPLFLYVGFESCTADRLSWLCGFWGYSCSYRLIIKCPIHGSFFLSVTHSLAHIWRQQTHFLLLLRH